MTLSTSLLAFQDCLELYDKALADDRGARMAVPDLNAAHRLRSRLHQARVLDRKQNAMAYTPGEPMHGRSVYDEITVRIMGGGGRVYVYLEKIKLSEAEIESLSEVEDDVATVIPPRQPQLIGPPQGITALLPDFKRRA